jgi:hypothetical protein
MITAIPSKVMMLDVMLIVLFGFCLNLDSYKSRQ